MPRKTTDNCTLSYIPFRCDVQTYDTIKKIAQGRNQSMSEVLRSLVSDGLVRQGYAQDEDYLYKLVSEAVAEQLRPVVERIAAITAKGTQMAGATFFMNVYAAAAALPHERERIEEAAGRARELGIQYLTLKGQKDKDLDRFLHQGAKEVIEDD